jgi:hypothetical protein
VAIEWSLLQEAGMAELLGSMLNPAGPLPDWYVMLLAADPPQRTDLTLADLTEPTDAGYSRKPLPRSGWVVGTPAAGCVHATMPAAPPVWLSVDETTDIFGAAYLRPADDALIAVYRFTDATRPTWASGSTLTLAPDFPLTSATC